MEAVDRMGGVEEITLFIAWPVWAHGGYLWDLFYISNWINVDRMDCVKNVHHGQAWISVIQRGTSVNHAGLSWTQHVQHGSVLNSMIRAEPRYFVQFHGSYFGGLGGPGSGSLDFSSAIRDNPVKGLNTDLVTGLLESSSCWTGSFFVTWLRFQFAFSYCKFLVNLLQLISFAVLWVGWPLVVPLGGCQVLFLQCNKVLGMRHLQWIGVLV